MPLQKQPAVTLAAVCRIKICGFLHSWSYWEHSTEKWWHRTGSPPVCQRRHTDPTEIAHSLSLVTRQLPFTFLLIFRVHGPHQHGTEINQLGQEGCFCKYSIPPGLNTPLPCRACTGSERYVPVWPSAPALVQTPLPGAALFCISQSLYSPSQLFSSLQRQTTAPIYSIPSLNTVFLLPTFFNGKYECSLCSLI